MMPPNGAQAPEPSAPPAPHSQGTSGKLANGTYPPLPSAPCPFPRATQPESPREQPKYFSTRSEAGCTQSPMHSEHPSFSRSDDASMASYRPGRSIHGPIKSEPLPSMEVTVTEPRVCHEPHKVAVPGFNRKYIKYTVTTTTDLKTFGYSPVQVVRRFSDFVDLEHLLRANHRGYFIPPRPLKYAAQGGKLKPQFIEQRRAALQQYLTSLCSHRVIARSSELRVFLEERVELRSSQAWLALHFPAPTWIQGVQRLLKQVVGKQAITPAPSEAARATAASHDVVRSVREALHSYRSNQDVNIPDKEQDVRRQSDLVKVLVSSVHGMSHATCAAQRLANDRLTIAGGLGRTFMHMSAFEAATAHHIEAEEAEKFGSGCQGVCTSAREEMAGAVSASKELAEQARMLGGALTALSAREEALRTARTLDDDLGRMRARSESMQASGHPKALQALQNLALAEAAQAAAWNEYEAVALRNEHDISGCAAQAVGEVLHKMLVWVECHAAASECEAAVWLRIARSLGADPTTVAALGDL